MASSEELIGKKTPRSAWAVGDDFEGQWVCWCVGVAGFHAEDALSCSACGADRPAASPLSVVRREILRSPYEIERIHRKRARKEADARPKSKDPERTIADLRDELRVTEELLEERQRVLDAIPECPVHGPCVPRALAWIKDARSDAGEPTGDPRYNAVAVEVEAFYPLVGPDIVAGETLYAGYEWAEGILSPDGSSEQNEISKITILHFHQMDRVQINLKSGHLWTRQVAPGDGWLESPGPTT